METPIKLTLGEIGSSIGILLLLLIISTSGFFLMIGLFVSPLTGFLLYKYRKYFPKNTYTHFFWTTGFIESNAVPNFFKQKKGNGLLNLVKNFFKKKSRYKAFGP
jgi:hypothetical protein